MVDLFGESEITNVIRKLGTVNYCVGEGRSDK